MGYTSAYDLEINYSYEYIDAHPGVTNPTPEEARTIVFLFRAHFPDAEFALDKNGACENWTKWDAHEDDLREFSLEEPDFLFRLHCEGEDGAQWEVYAKNGKCKTVEPEVIWPDFDEVDLD